MGKLRKTVLIFVIILVQSALSITAGIAAISLFAGDTFPPGIHVGNVNISGMGKIEASKAIDDNFRAILVKDSLSISVDSVDYHIPYDDFDVSIDSVSTVDFMNDWKSTAYIPNLINSYFGQGRVNIRPVIKYNEGKLIQKLIELSKQIDIAPVNASISIKDGKVVKKAETSGYTLNIANTAATIRNHLSDYTGTTLILNGGENAEIQTVNPEVMLKDFADIEQIISEYSTYVTETELLASVKLAAKAIDGIVLSGSGNNNSENVKFSFVEELKNSDKNFENDNEGYDQVASTLYAALLSAGINKEAITRLPHKLAVEYIEPGLDAWISGNGGDLKFQNTLEHKIALFAEVEADKLTISLAGSLMDKRQSYDLEVETIQRFSPPVVNLENKNLKPGEKIMLNPGKEGLLVQVFRNDELISEDRYEAEKAMVQIGPGTAWVNEEDK